LEIPLSLKEEIPETKKIRITRIHLEEDAGKLSHSKDKKNSFVNFNRAGVPLAELVTEPDIENGYQARMFAEELRRILRYLNICDGNMEKGEMRCEVNISIAKKGSDKLGNKVEIKNLNSFRAVEKSIDFEIKRQREILEKKEKVIQETRGWDENREITFHQRIKEGSSDYRYFPEPDLPALKIDDIFDLKKIEKEILELPAEKRIRFVNDFGLNFKEVFLLTDDLETAQYFENIVLELNKIEKFKENELKKILKLSFNYFTTDLKALLSEGKTEIQNIKFKPKDFALLMNFAHKKEISSAAVKLVLSEMFSTGKNPQEIIKEKNLIQVSEEGELEEFIKKAISESPQAVEDYKKGKENALQFLVGKSMALSKGRANPEILRKEIKKMIGE
jgi:aspartyl-tRNA(Asn)/glutamyl-tRNA(Gln) amidotransferase subunit B